MKLKASATWLSIVSLSLVHSLPVIHRDIQKRSNPLGIDLSDTEVDLGNAGATFAFIQATEGTSTVSDTFSSQFNAATNAGIIRGGSHLAKPDESDGGTQAAFFLSNGGQWSDDGITLPGALYLDDNPDGSQCFDLSSDDLVSWISDFSSAYQQSTGRVPVIKTTVDWWDTCTDGNTDFSNNPLWIGAFSGDLPAGWSFATFWENADGQATPGSDDPFPGGDAADLLRFVQAEFQLGNRWLALLAISSKYYGTK